MSDFAISPHLQINTAGWSYKDWLGQFYSQSQYSIKKMH